MTFDFDLVSAITIIVPALFGAFFWSLLNRTYRFLSLFVWCTAAIEVLARVYYELGWNNMFVFHLYSYVEVGFISLIYYSLSDHRPWKRAILVTLSLFFLVSVLNLWFFDELTNFNSVQRYVEVVIVYAMLSAFLLKAVYEPKNKPFLQNPAILLTLGFMIYFLGTLFLFAFGREILSGNDGKYWVIHGIFNIFLNGMFALVIWKSARRNNALDLPNL